MKKPTKKINHNALKFLVPEGVSSMLEDLVVDTKEYKALEVAYFKYLYIMNVITKHQYTNSISHNVVDGLTDNLYTGCPLNMTTLSSILGTSNKLTKSMLDNLISLGLIVRRGGYVKGSSSFKYALGYKCSLESFEEVEALIQFTKIPTKIIKRRNMMYEVSEKDLALYQSYMSNLTISLSSDFSTISPMMGTFAKVSTIEANMIAVKSINDGDWFCHRPTLGSRVHTNLTNLNRKFRPYLQYKGEDLVELDIRNSQPLLASILIKNWFIQKNMDVPADVKEYKENCENGTFYDYFMELNNIGSDEISRKNFKQQIFGEVFFSKVSKRQTKLKKQFIEKYPNCYKAICDIKGGLGSESYNQFAIMLQKKEAGLIYDTVNLGLLREGVPAFNIFDSILVPKQYKEVAESLILDSFLKENVTPKINYTDYSIVKAQIEMDKQTTDKMTVKEVVELGKTVVNTNGVVIVPLKDFSAYLTYSIDSTSTVEVLMPPESLNKLRVKDIDYNYIIKQQSK